MRKMLAALLFALLLLSPRLEAQPPEPVNAAQKQWPPYIREQLTTPEGTLQIFIQHLESPVWGAQLVKGARLENLPKYEQDFRKAGEGIHIDVQDIRIEPNDGQGNQQVTAHFKISFFRDWASPFFRVSREDRLILQWEDGIWKIVPANPQELLEPQTSYTYPDTNYLLARATALAFPEQMFGFIHARECQSNLKQIGLGMMQLAQDYEGKFSIDNAAENNRFVDNTPKMDWENIPLFVTAVLPYAKASEIFHCPADPTASVSYSFNPNLENISQFAVAAPSKVVLIYEGKDGTLDFRHDGKANITFADGHVESVDAERAKTLRWKP